MESNIVLKYGQGHKYNYESLSIIHIIYGVVLEAQLLYVIDVILTLSHNVIFSFVDHISIVCCSIWTYYTGLTPII